MKRTFNTDAIKRILEHPSIKPHISDNQDDYQIPINDDIHYLIGEGALFIFHPFQDGYEAHVNIIKEQRHKAIELGFEAIEYAKTIGKTFYTHVPKKYPNVRDYTLKLGLEMKDKQDHWQFFKEFK